MISGASSPLAVERHGRRHSPVLADLSRQALLCALGALILCAPALYNGYPLIFADLLDYGVDGMRIVRAEWPGGNHPPFYGVAIEFLHLERTLWPVIVVQGLVVTHLLHVVLRALGVQLSAVSFLGLIAAMAALTSLPWYVSVVMPDLFGGIVVLCLFLLIALPHRLNLLEKLYFAALSVACLLFHVSFVPVAAGILALASLAALLRRGQPSRPRLALGFATLLTALVVSALISIKFWGVPSGPPYSPPYLLAHTLVDGPGKQFLQRQCATEHFVLCDYQEIIPDDVEEFMFRSYSPFFSSWETNKIRAEAPAIVKGTFAMFPLQTLAAALRDGLTQVGTFNTEVAQLEDLPNDRGGSFGTEFAIRLPFVARGYEGTAQARGLLSPANLAPMNAVHAVIVALSTLLIAVQLVRAARRRDWPVIELLVIVAASVVINGMVAGAAVGVFGRFGARVIWLLPFAAIAAVLATSRQPASAMVRRRSDVPSGGSRI